MPLARWSTVWTFLCSSLLAVAPCRAASPAIHLIDRAPGRQTATIIDATRIRIFDPAFDEVVIPFPDDLPPQPTLRFDLGLRPSESAMTVRFEVWLRGADGAERKLYGADVSEPGWRPSEIALERPSDRSSLVFRRNVVEGPRTGMLLSGWGNPVIVSGEPVTAASVILISLDTLRADHVGLYGYPAAQTPALDALAKEGVWYRHAYSPSLWTLPSHASLFYGRHLGAMPPPDDASVPRLRALAELLREAGYLTAGFTGGGFMSHNFDFSRGFDLYYAFPQPKLQAGSCPPERLDGTQVFAGAEAWLRERGRRAPFFLFLHTYDIHDRCPFLQYDPNGRGRWALRSDTERAHMLTFYDALIGSTDNLLGGLLAELDRLGLSETTLIAITSDHGELFREHGLDGHGCDRKPYEGITRVPLILRYPTALKPRGVIDEPVSLLDLAPSILALLRLPVPPSMQGNVLPGLGIDARHPRAPVTVVCDDNLMLRDGRYKLLMSRSAAFPDELYDLVADPAETKNLADRTALIAPLRAAAAELAPRLPPPRTTAKAEPEQLDEGTRERLRALGYQ